MGTENRRKTKQIMVRVSPEEHEQIKQAASQCDLSAPAFLRELGMGYQPQSTVDMQAIEKLAHLHGDIGRVGGLLKMWLTMPEKEGFSRHLHIPALVHQLIELQKEIGEVVKKL